MPDQIGQLLITQAAARQYAEARGLGLEEARRVLTVLRHYAPRRSRR